MSSKYASPREKNIAWFRTKKGVLLRLYRNQLSRSLLKGFPPPNYSHQYLYERFLEDPTFCRLYDIWVQNGYIRWDKPSIDRVDPKLPYTKTNIQILSYKENARKANESERARTEVIMCDLDGTEIRKFRSMTEAAAFVGSTTANIGECCKDMRYTAKGYRWTYGDVKKFALTHEYHSKPNRPWERDELRDKALGFWQSNPHLYARHVAERFGVPTKTVYTWRYRQQYLGAAND